MHSKGIIAVRTGGESHFCDLSYGLGGVVVSLIEERHVRTSLPDTVNDHPIHFSNVGTK